MYLLITLFIILMDLKVRHLKKKKKQTARAGSTRGNYTPQNTQISKTKYIILYSNEGTIDYNQQCHPLHLGNEQYKQFPQNQKKAKNKKKNLKKEEERREREEERVRTGRKRRRKRRRKKRKRKKRRKKRRKWKKRY